MAKQFHNNQDLVNAVARAFADPTINDSSEAIKIGNSLLTSDGIAYYVQPARTSQLRFATFGDSTANTVSTIHDQDYITGVFPASGSTTVGFHFIKSNFQTFYPLAEFVGNGGISGDTTTAMLARDNSAAATTRKAITDIIDLSPAVVLFHGGSINDILNKNSSTMPAAAAACFTQHVEAVERFLAAGIVVIDSGIFGYSGADAELALVRKNLLEINSNIRNYAKTKTKNYYFIDCLGLLHDSSGAYLPGMSNDGTHLNSKGSNLLSSKEAEIASIVFGVPAGRKFTGTNLISNSVFSAVTSDAKGIYPTGVTFGLTAATITNSEIKVIDEKRWATFVATPSAAATVTIKLPFDPTAMSIVAGDNFGWELEFFVEALDGAAITLTTAYVRLDLYKTAAGRLIYEQSFNGVMGAETKLRGLCTKKIKIPEDSAALTTSSAFQLTLQTSELRPLRIGICNPVFTKLI